MTICHLEFSISVTVINNKNIVFVFLSGIYYIYWQLFIKPFEMWQKCNISQKDGKQEVIHRDIRLPDERGRH